MSWDLDIERDTPTAVYQQIVAGIRARIAAGALRAGDRLPTSRELALSLGVNRSTIVAAYREMAEGGELVATVGRGTFVAPGEPVRRAGETGGPPAHTAVQRDGWQPVLSRPIENATQLGIPEVDALDDHPQPVDFAALAPDEDLFPVGDFGHLLARLLEERGRELLQYGAPEGEPELRELIAGELAVAGTPVSAGDVVIVNGIQQGIDLTLRVLVNPGDVVVVESPTYVSVLPTLALYRAEVAEVPMTPRGLDVGELARIVHRRRPRLIYTMPNFQNPTGVTMDGASRRRVVEIAAEHGTAILEDDYEKDLRLEGRALPSLKALDPHGLVIHMGTFSKGLFPGLRLGWIAAPPPIVEALKLAKRIADLHTSSLIQAAVAAFCSHGHYRRHVAKLKRVYRERQRAALAAMERAFPSGVRWTRPEGGFVLWVTLPPPLRASAVLREARAEGVAASPGTLFFHAGRDAARGERHFRISIARTSIADIERGIEVLGAIMHRQRGTPARPSAGRPARATLPQL